MDTLRALLWKEGRAAASRVAACACLALLAGLAHGLVLSPRLAWLSCHLVGILGAILMSMDLVAGERGRGTLPFQSNLPVRTAWLLGVKFSSWGRGAPCSVGRVLGRSLPRDSTLGECRLPLERFLASYEHPLLMEILKDVGYGRILLLWFLFSLIFYSGAFLSSTLSNRPFQAAWTSLLMGFVVHFLVMASRVSDSVAFYWWQVLGLDLDGQILRPAFDPTLLLARVASSLPAGRLCAGMDLPRPSERKGAVDSSGS